MGPVQNLGQYELAAELRVTARKLFNRARLDLEAADLAMQASESAEVQHMTPTELASLRELVRQLRLSEMGR